MSPNTEPGGPEIMLQNIFLKVLVSTLGRPQVPG
jgi:hypothetical protein